MPGQLLGSGVPGSVKMAEVSVTLVALRRSQGIQMLLLALPD
jgi:hypothetical protein